MAPTYTTPSTKYGIHRVDGSTSVSDVDAAINQAVDDVDANMAGYAEGTLSGRDAVVATAGKLYRTTDTGQLFMGTGSAWIEIGVAPWQPGDLKASWVTAAPAGWLLCDGSAVSRATYAALFTAIGTSAGAGNGSTTFNVPDFRGRTIVMPDGAAGRMADTDARGNGGGADYVTLAEAQMPSHHHDTLYEEGTFGNGGTTSVLRVFDVVGAVGTPGLVSTSATGGGQAHENRMPYLVAGSVLIRT